MITITADQAQRAIQTGVCVVDVQRSRTEFETVSFTCDNAAAFYQLIGQIQAGAVFRMATTFWPKNNDYSTSPMRDSMVAITPADLNFIAETFVATWGSNTGRGVYGRGTGTPIP